MPKKITKSPTFSSTTSGSSASHSLSAANIPHILKDGGPLPELFVFDLDYTLWPFWVDTHVSGSSLKTVPGSNNTACTDRTGESFSFYRDVPAILYTLPQLGIKAGVASRTSAPELARDMLKLLHVHPPNAPSSDSISNSIDGEQQSSKKKKEASGGKTKKAIDLFDAGLQIYPGCKITHMQKLHRDTGVPFDEFLFFDDEHRNRDTESLGVTMHLVRDGVTWGEIEAGVKEWRRRRGSTAGKKGFGDGDET